MFSFLYDWIGFFVVNGAIVLFVLGLIQFLYGKVRPSQLDYKNKHVIITGASSGLGNEYAKLVAKAGGKLSIISRNPKRLKAAQDDLSTLSSHNVVAVSADVTDGKAVNEAVKQAIEAHGLPDVVVACAGLSHPGLFEEVSVEAHRKEMELNYFGTMHFVKAAIPGLIENKGGKLVIVASGAALIGFIGYSAYCPTKFAVRGFGDVLRNELKRYNIDVSLYWPNSMATPGFDQEQKTKPQSTKTIEDTDVLLSATDAARILDDGLKAGQYHITTDFVSDLLRMGVNGVTPRVNLWWEALIAPLMPFITEGAVFWIDSEANKENKTKLK